MANNHYSLKDKKISVWRFTSTTSMGVEVKRFVARYRSIWAYYRHNGGTAALEGSALRVYDENAVALFIINRRDDIDIDDYIVYNHKVYQITRIDDFEGYRDDIKLTCKLSKQTFTNGLVDD